MDLESITRMLAENPMTPFVFDRNTGEGIASAEWLCAATDKSLLHASYYDAAYIGAL